MNQKNGLKANEDEIKIECTMKEQDLAVLN